LCYINDFWLASRLFSVLFEHNATSLGKGKSLPELTAFVNQELQKISNWFRANKMAVNTAKTKLIVFWTRGKNINPTDCHLVYNETKSTSQKINLSYMKKKEFIMMRPPKILSF
jgi:hypothetical protein